MYIDTIVCRFCLEALNPVSTLLNMNITLLKDIYPKDNESRGQKKNTPYLPGVSSLMYAPMATQPDITYVTN